MKLRALHLAYVLGLSAAVTLPAAMPSAAFAQDADDEEAVDEEELDEESARDADPTALTVYRDDLAPHGTWVVDGTYGTVWVPSASAVGPNFAPYVTSGRWELTDDGDWLWVSDYSWGYIPFHYGRWVWTGGYGWAWIPGRVYSNAWVVWRVGAGGYIGWAPMAPSWYWSDGYAVVLYSPPPAAYVFCHGHHVFHHHVHSYVVRDRAEVQRAAASTRPQARGRTYTPASPTLKQANVDEKSAPKSRTRPDDKALKFDPKARRAGAPGSSAGAKAPSRPNKGTRDLTASEAKATAGRNLRGNDVRRTSTADAPKTRNVRAGTRSLGEAPANVTRPERGGLDRSGPEKATRSDFADVPERGNTSPSINRVPRNNAPRAVDAPRSSGATPKTNPPANRAPKASAPSYEAPSSPPVNRSSSPKSSPSRSDSSPSMSRSPSRISGGSSTRAPSAAPYVAPKPVPKSAPRSAPAAPRRGRR